MSNNETSMAIIESLQKENGKQRAIAMNDLVQGLVKLETTIALVKEALATGNLSAVQSVARRPGSLSDEASNVDTALGIIATLADTKDALDWNLEQLP